jgi:AraC-like DNA-binding protein
MEYREIQPGLAVGRFIQCYWVLEDSAPNGIAQTIVPDGRSELIINLGQPFQQEISGTWHSQPAVFLVGQITGPFLVRPQGPARTIGVRFRPEGAGWLFGLPMFELTDSAVAVEEISPILHKRLERLAELSSLREQLFALDQLLLSIVEQNEGDKLVSAAITQFEQANGLVSIRELAAWLGVSPRQFERRFKHAVGIPPKLFSRMRRFQKVFQSMESGATNWVDAAIACGYYDQAHLIRDFREFSGVTPTSLLAKEFDLTRLFAQHQEMTHFSNTKPQALR